MNDPSKYVQIAVVLGPEPPEPSVAELYRVQAAIAQEVRGKVDVVKGAVLSSEAQLAGPRIRLQPGAGALLRGEVLQSLVDSLLRLPPAAEHAVVSLPVEGFRSMDGLDLPHTGGTCFAVRSVADVLALSLHPDAGRAVRRSWASLSLDTGRMEAAMRVFADRQGEVVVIGPITSHTWRYLENEVACRVRIFADGADHRGGLAGAMYRRARTEEFVNWLREMGHAIFLDSRQMFVDEEMPTDREFFLSDLGRSEDVQHPELRRLTEISLTTDFPVVLGGPSLVNGALFALVEAAWRTGKDVDRGYHVAW